LQWHFLIYFYFYVYVFLYQLFWLFYTMLFMQVLCFFLFTPSFVVVELCYNHSQGTLSFGHRLLKYHPIFSYCNYFTQFSFVQLFLFLSLNLGEWVKLRNIVWFSWFH
jgi:hypothetical protein